MTMLLGHRGFKGPLENTLPAFRRALEYADGIEFDVRVTEDRKLIVHHDAFFTSKGATYQISELTVRELWKSHPLGKLVPRVRWVLELNSRIFNADVKEEEAVEPLLKLSERTGTLKRTVFSSESPSIVKSILRECPNCRVGFSIAGYSSLRWIPIIKGIYSLHVPIDAVSYVGYHALTSLMRAVRKRGIRIFLWNYLMDEFIWVPRFLPFVDSIISDNPARLRKVFYGEGRM